MKIKQAVFVTSSKKPGQYPNTGLPEIAFIGRSNVGKSSLINMLMEKRNLAKTSSTPGKTQLINHFLVNGQWHLVDLPGFGWAKVSKDKKRQWAKMTKEYLVHRKTLFLTFMLVDSRLEPQKNDIEFINWMGKNQVPFVIIFTKTDKLSKSKISKNINQFNKRLLETWDELPPTFKSSSVSKEGRQEILQYLDDVLKDVI